MGWFQMRNMDSNMMLFFGLLVFGIALTTAIPIDDGGLDSFMKTQSFSSSMSNINGDKHEDSIFRNGAQLNGDPIYLMSGENHNDNDDIREALDVILPQRMSTHMLTVKMAKNQFMKNP